MVFGILAGQMGDFGQEGLAGEFAGLGGGLVGIRIGKGLEVGREIWYKRG